MQQEWKDRILDGMVRVYRSKGLRLTMDDLAAELGMSKKSIYAVYRNKTDILVDTVDRIFDAVAAEQARVLADPQLTTVQKLTAIMSVMPAAYGDVDMTQMHELRARFPEAYDRVQARLQSGWEETFRLMDQGVAEGVMRPVDQEMFRLMFVALLEQFFQQDVLVRCRITYQEALRRIADILVNGIIVK